MIYHVAENKVIRKYPSLEEFTLAIRKEKIKPTALYWTKGMKDWQRVSSFSLKESSLNDKSVQNTLKETEEAKGSNSKHQMIKSSLIGGVMLMGLIFFNYLAKADLLIVLAASFSGGLLGFSLLFGISFLKQVFSKKKPILSSQKQ